MSKYVVLRLQGEETLWLIDFQNRSVAPVDADPGRSAATSKAVAELLAGIRGVELAVLADSRAEVASLKLWSES